MDLWKIRDSNNYLKNTKKINISGLPYWILTLEMNVNDLSFSQGEMTQGYDDPLHF
jgi:hypothetical protein